MNEKTTSGNEVDDEDEGSAETSRPRRDPVAPKKPEGDNGWRINQELNPLELVLAAVALVTLGFLYQQGRDIEKAHNVAAKSAQAALEQVIVMQRSQRAYVSLDYKLEQHVTDSGDIQFIFTWRNTGTTVARSGFTGVTGFGQPSSNEVVDFSQCFEKSLEAGTSSQRALGPGETTIGRHTLTVPILRMIADGTTRGFVCGWFVYRDVFDSSPVRLTEFCREIGPVQFSAASGRIDIQPWFTSCNKHNCFDQDCPDYREKVDQYERLLKKLSAKLR